MSNSKFKGLRCIGLVRTSSDEQSEASIPQQIELLKHFAKQHGMIWVGVVIADGVSGSKPGERDDLSQIKERKLLNNDFDVVLVQDRSRLTRSGQDHAAWLKFEFKMLGVQIISATNATAGDERYSWVVDGLDDDAANAYIRNAARDQSRGWQKKLEEGLLANCSVTPYGIDRLYLSAEDQPLFVIRDLPDGRQHRLDPETGKVLETYPAPVKGQATRRYRKQSHEKVKLIPGTSEQVETARYIHIQHHLHHWGYWRISDALNAMGSVTLRGKRWSNASVASVLHCTLYCGIGMFNMWDGGRFWNRDRHQPRALAFDAASMMKRNKCQKLRPPEDWMATPYEALNVFIPDEDMRQAIYRKQMEYYLKKQAGLHCKPRRDRHADSPYFLKHILECSHTKKGLVGKLGRGNIRYYHVAHAKKYEGRKELLLTRMVPAVPVEQAIKGVLGEVLSGYAEFEPMIREAVEGEAQRRDTRMTEISAIEREQATLSAQIAFTIRNLEELGEEATTKALLPLKQRLLALNLRHDEVSRLNVSKAVNVGAVMKAIKESLTKLGSTVVDMPFAVFRSVIQSFMTLTINLKEMVIDLDISMPEDIAISPERLNALVGPVPVCHQGCSNEAHSENRLKIAKYRCQVVNGVAMSKSRPATCTCRRVKTGEIGNPESKAA